MKNTWFESTVAFRIMAVRDKMNRIKEGEALIQDLKDFWVVTATFVASERYLEEMKAIHRNMRKS